MDKTFLRMARRTINTIDDFISLEGELLGESRWIEINQEIINHFADVTFDHQWIHIDHERALVESPYKSTIAHGYLTLSLLPYLLDDIIEVNNLEYLVNYGIKDMTYKSVVLSGNRIRLVATLNKAKDLGNICKADIHCRFEIDGQDEPALEGSIIYLYYFT